MRLWEVIIVSVGLSLDAFTIAVFRGSTQGRLNKLTAALVGIIFGLIQTLMLAAGMIIAIFPMLNIQNEKIISINQWFSAIILIYLGVKSLKNSFKITSYDEKRQEFFGYKYSAGLAFATSIDALAMGVTFAFLNVKIVPAISFIGIVTFTCSAIGVKIGNVFGLKYKSKAEIVGGVILILLGCKILVEHLGII